MVEDFAGNIAIAKLGDHLPKTIGNDLVHLTLTDGNYQKKVGYEDNLDMVATDTGLVTNQAQLAVSHRNRPHSQLVTLNQDFFISPNDDANKDFVAFKGLPNKTYNNLQVTVFAAEDQQRLTPIWFSQPGADLSDIESTAWRGITAGGEKVLSGSYQYVITYHDANNHAQEKVFKVSVNHNKPILTQGSFRKDDDVEFFTPGSHRRLVAQGLLVSRCFISLRKMVDYLMSSSPNILFPLLITRF